MEGHEQGPVTELIEASQVRFQQGKYQEAREDWERALEMLRIDLGDDHLSIACALHEIGSILIIEEEADEALEKFNRALAIQVERLGRHSETAQTYMLIGCILEDRDGQKAEEMFQKALEIILELLPNDHHEVSQLYFFLVRSMLKQDHPGVVNVYSGITNLLRSQHRLDDALQMIDRAIEVCNRLGNSDMDLLGKTLYIKADILREKGNLVAETEALNKRLKVHIKTVGEMHITTAWVYDQIGRAYVKQEMVEDAINAYSKAMNIRKELGSDHSKIKKLEVDLEWLKYGRQFKAFELERDTKIAILNEEGLARKVEGDSEKAVQLFQEALDMYKETSSTVTPTLANLY
ncbi:unnamed protein product, partial [Cylindrotheca closterium]